jgi:hypothetical protein
VLEDNAYVTNFEKLPVLEMSEVRESVDMPTNFFPDSELRKARQNHDVSLQEMRYSPRLISYDDILGVIGVYNLGTNAVVLRASGGLIYTEDVATSLQTLLCTSGEFFKTLEGAILRV